MGEKTIIITMWTIAALLVALWMPKPWLAPAFEGVGDEAQVRLGWLAMLLTVVGSILIVALNRLSRTRSPYWYWFAAIVAGVAAIVLFFSHGFFGAEIVGI